jgi:hypothetical protein
MKLSTLLRFPGFSGSVMHCAFTSQKVRAKRVKLSQPMQSLLDTQTLPKKRPDANFEMSQLQTTLALQLRPESAPLMTATYSKGNFVKSTTALSLSERSHCYMLHSATICHGTS